MPENTVLTSLTGEPQDVPGTTGPDTSLPTGPQQGSNKTRKKGWKRPEVVFVGYCVINATKLLAYFVTIQSSWPMQLGI